MPACSCPILNRCRNAHLARMEAGWRLVGMMGQVRIWLTSALSGNPLVLNDEDQPTWMSFDPTGSLLASAGVEGAVRVWDTSTGRLRSPIFTHRATVCRLAFNADGSLLATACADGRVHLGLSERDNNWEPLRTKVL